MARQASTTHWARCIRKRLSFEPLEPRVLLSGTAYVVDSLGDTVASDGVVALREAIQAANTNAAVHDAAAGSAADTDTITFDQAALEAEALAADPGWIPADGLTITLGGTQLDITDDLSITGLGQDVLAIDGDGISRVLNTTAVAVELSGLTITGGHTWDNEHGGGVYQDAGTLTLTDCTVSGNTTESGMWIYGNGGGIFSDSGTLTLTNSTVSGNTAGYHGGGICSYGSTVTLTGSTVDGNTIRWSGGGIYSSGALTLTDSTVSGNATITTLGAGGGICNDGGTATLTNSRIAGNTARWNVGGISNQDGEMTLTNCAVTGNTSDFTTGGIGNDGGTLTLTNSTVSGNSADDLGGGIYNAASSTLTLNNCIVALNTATGGAWDIEGATSGQRNLIGVDPGFVDAPGGDYRLAGTSIAIDQGDDSLAVDPQAQPLLVDLDGNTRIVGGSVDLGAYEYQGAPTAHEAPSTVVTTNLDVVDPTDDETSLREAIFHATIGGLASPVTFAPSLVQAQIALSQGDLAIRSDVSIDATSVQDITIDAGAASRVFSIGGADTDVALTALTITDGRSEFDGGGVLNHDGTVMLTDCTVSGNTIDDKGGGICNYGGTVTLANSTVSGNTARTAGGVYTDGGTLTLTDSTIDGNAGSSTSGGKFWYGAGGGIYSSDSTVTLTGSTVDGNSANKGAGIHSFSGTLTVTGSTISGNTATAQSGGIDNYGATVTVANSAVVGNTAEMGAGGMYNNTGTVTLTNCTISGNAATGTTSWLGGTGGVSSYAGTLALNNCIVALNTGTGASWDVEGAITGQRYLVGIDPGFVDAAGGDYRLSGTSIAIDLGDDALAVDPLAQPLTVDLGGDTRIVGASVDLGAYEYQGVPAAREAPSTVVTTDADTADPTDDETSLREAVFHATLGGLSSAVTFAPSLVQAQLALSSGDLAIPSDISIDATSVENVTVAADGSSRVFTVTGSDTDATLTNLTVSGGWGAIGGGICSYSATLEVKGCTITRNAAPTSGSGMYRSGAGGGIYNAAGALTVTNCAVTGNTANEGAGIYNDTTTTTVTNSTISGNEARGFEGFRGGGVFNYMGTVTLNNTVVARNVGAPSPDTSSPFGGAINEQNSLVGGDPGFVLDPSAGDDGTWGTDDDLGDLRPAAGSALINAGSNALAVDAGGTPISVDLDGSARIFGASVDIGAYEFGVANDPPQLTLDSPAAPVDVDAGDDVAITWTDDDPDDNATISLAFDPDGGADPWADADHTWITQALTEDPDGVDDQFTWDTTGVPTGTYTVWGVIDDGINAPVYSRAAGQVTVQGTVAEHTIFSPDGQVKVVLYDTLGAGIDLPNAVKVKFGKNNRVSSIKVIGNDPLTGLGILVVDASVVGKVVDGRKGAPGGMAFIASTAYVGKVKLKAGLTGFNLNGENLHGVAFAPDLNGDGDATDLTGLWLPAGGGSIKILGSLLCDVIGDGGLRKLASGDVGPDVYIIIGAPPKPRATTSLVFGRVADLIIQSDTPIKSVVAKEWLDTGGAADSIIAPWLGKLTTKGQKAKLKKGIIGLAGDFEASFDLDGTGSPKLTLGKAKIAGSVAQGTWTIAGAVGAVAVKVDFCADLDALSVKSMSVKRNLDGARIDLTQAVDPKLKALSKLAVTGWVIDSAIASAGHVGTFQAGGMDASSLFLGVAGGALPDEAADFAGETLLGSFAVKGIKGLAGDFFINSNVAARTVSKAAIRDVLTDNGGVGFGICGVEVVSVTWQQGTDRYKWPDEWPGAAVTVDFVAEEVV